MYDFPASPAENDEYTPPVGGQVYIYKAPRWLVKGIPPAGGGGGGGIDEAPIDGKQYGREDTAWTEVLPNPDWVTLAGKPATFPPTVPIPWADVSGKPATFPPSLPIPSSGVTGLDSAQAAQDTVIGTKLNSSAYTAADVLAKLLTVDGVGSSLDADLLDGQSGAYYLSWANFTGKPSTFPPTLPIAQSDVTNLVTDLAAKAPLASPTLTGDPKAPTPATADNDTSIATTAHVQANAALKVAKAGDTMTGPLIVQGSITCNGNFVTSVASALLATGSAGTIYFRPNGAGSAVGQATIASDGKMVVAVDPTAALGVATKQYVDAKPGGAFTSNVPPATPVDGQLWWKSDTGNTYIWYDDGSSAQWVQVNVTTLPADYRTAETRNRIVNGAMQISQENGDAAVLTGAYPADQWIGLSAIASVGFARGRPAGSGNDYVGVNAPAKPALAVGDYHLFRQNIEGTRVKDFRYGTANAKQAVLRFSVYGPTAGTYAVAVKNAAVDRTFLAPFTIPATTWTEIVIVIPGDTAGTWLTTTGIGLMLEFNFATGSNLLGAAGWQAGNKHGITGMTNGAVSGGQFFIADVGLYLDPLNTGGPPRWQMPDEAEELRACMRYFRSYGGAAAYEAYAVGLAYNSGSSSVYFRFDSPMRVAPALTYAGNIGVINAAGGVIAIGSVTLSHGGPASASVTATVASGLVAGNSTALLSNNDLNARLRFSARM